MDVPYSPAYGSCRRSSADATHSKETSLSCLENQSFSTIRPVGCAQQRKRRNKRPRAVMLQASRTTKTTRLKSTGKRLAIDSSKSRRQGTSKLDGSASRIKKAVEMRTLQSTHSTVHSSMGRSEGMLEGISCLAGSALGRIQKTSRCCMCLD